LRKEREKRTLQDARRRETTFISSAVMCASAEQLAIPCCPWSLKDEKCSKKKEKQRTSKMQLEKRKGEDLHCRGCYVCQHGTACRSNMVLTKSKVPLAMSGMDLTASSSVG
jgi:hypothetical protein